ncbi:UDP-glucose 4-epimerase GalE [Aeromicrobium sp.]|uniref:UDP-glucose 4-epimerase GalE n=1 Tax=Aeromicrobium sp. TaxID=1871063 RepID=UPI003D6C4BEF
MRVLLAGGAGYIGSHTAVQLIGAGHDVEIVDNFSNSKPEAVRQIQTITGAEVAVYEIDIRDRVAVSNLIAGRDYAAVVHFAAIKAVGESLAKPLEYYDHNMSVTFSLLSAMQEHGLHTLVFSSSATVYGDLVIPPFHEDQRPLESASPYGQTKIMTERLLSDLAAADPPWRIAVLRYFNPVGAHPSGLIGEDPKGTPDNLVPFIAQVAVGRRDKLMIFGDDYETKDGTGERDYIHVDDIAAGHLAALEAIVDGDPHVRTWNLGGGAGTSVFEMLHAFERACGREIPFEIVERRSGDVAAAWADPSRARAELGWEVQRSLDEMCADAWRWQSQNPDGYSAT